MMVSASLTAAGCRGKHKFGSFTEAEKAARRQRRSGESNTSPFRCKSCPYWHVGRVLGGSKAASREWRRRKARVIEREEWA